MEVTAITLESVAAKPVRPWCAAPMRELADGVKERFCRICKKWHLLSEYRAYGNGSYCAICQSCERAARRMRYLRDRDKEQTRAKNWGRLRRAQAKQTADAPPVEPVATGSVEWERVMNEAENLAGGTLLSAG